MRILITNDDGIHAPGLKVLEAIARSLSKDVWIVAPETEQSGASHSLTLSRPLRVRKISTRKYAVDGTPTDCTLMALTEIIKGAKPDLVLSGVNRGANLAEDVTYSGTVAAAMEATLLGVPAIAMSQVLSFGHPVKWATAENHAPPLIRKLVKAGWPRNVLLNINFPDVIAESVKGVRVTTQGQRDLSDLVMDKRVDARGFPYYWIGFRREIGLPEPGTDMDAVAKGYVSLTALQLNLTDEPTMAALKKAIR